MEGRGTKLESEDRIYMKIRPIASYLAAALP